MEGLWLYLAWHVPQSSENYYQNFNLLPLYPHTLWLHRNVLLHKLSTWRNTHSQICYNLMYDSMIMLHEKVQHLIENKAYHCLPCGLQHCACGQILPCPDTGPQIWWAVWWCPHPDHCTEQGAEVESRGTETGAPSQTRPGSSGSWHHNTLLQTGGDYLARRMLQQTALPRV